jgi:hypothetical protein
MSEAAVIKAITDYLLYQGCLVLRINSGAAQPDRANGSRGYLAFNRWQTLGDDSQTAGVSDILAVASGRLICIEVKAPGKKGNVSPAQARFMAAARMRGAVCVVADCLEDVMQALLGVKP